MAQPSQIAFLPFEAHAQSQPGNVLSEYYKGQQEQEDRARAMQRQDKMDMRADQQFAGQQDVQKIDLALKRGQALTQLLGAVRDGDAQGFEAAKMQASQQFGIPPEQVAHLTIADLPRLRAESGQAMRDLELQAKRASINASNAQAEAAMALAGQRAGGGGGPPLTNTDKREIYDTDELVGANKSAVSLLRQALDLSNRSYQGPGAQTVASGLSIFGAPMAENTIEFDNLLKQNVLPQLKAIFGGMPTEGERKVLLDLQGSSSLQRSVRNKIIATALRLAEARLRFNQDKAKQLRSGTYYNQAPDFSIEAAPAAQQQPRATAAAPPAQPQGGAVTWQFDANGNLVPGK